MEGQKKKQKRGFPIKDFGNDRKRGCHPGDFRAVFSLPLNASIKYEGAAPPHNLCSVE
jgi:hypothetical protein